MAETRALAAMDGRRNDPQDADSLVGVRVAPSRKVAPAAAYLPCTA